MVCLFLRHQFSSKPPQPVVNATLPRPNKSWFEIHYNERRISEEYFRKQLLRTDNWTQTRQVVISDKWLTSLAQVCYFVDLPGTNFVGGACEDLSASDKICQVATNRPHLWSVGDDRKFVKINNFFVSADRPIANDYHINICPRRVLASRGGTLGFPACIHIRNFKSKKVSTVSKLVVYGKNLYLIKLGAHGRLG